MDEGYSRLRATTMLLTSLCMNSPGYILESDPKKDDDKDPEEDPADLYDDRGIDEEEERATSSADLYKLLLYSYDQATSACGGRSVWNDENAATPPPHPAYRVTSRISIPAQVPTPVWFDLEIPSPPLPVSSPGAVLSPSPPTSPICPLGYRVVIIRLRAEAASTSHSLPLPPPIILSHTRLDAPSSGTPPLHLLSTDRRSDRPEVTLQPQKRLCIALGPRYEVGESSSAAAARPARGLRTDYGFVATMDREIKRDLERDVGYGITDSWDEIVEAMQGTLVVTDVAEFSQRMTEFETRVRQDTDKIYTRLDDEQSERHLMDSRLNMLYRDRRAHARTARHIETESIITTGSDYKATSSRPQEVGGDYRDAGGRSQEAEAVHRGTEAAEETSDSDDRVRETARTRQRSCTTRCTRGGWQQFLDFVMASYFVQPTKYYG
ncbi:hypothetical protein Tco_1154638 [Tanacetum coccineum]